MDCPCEFGIEPPHSISHGVSLGIINSTSKLIQNSTRLEINSTLVLLIVLHDGDVWTIRKKYISRLKTTKILFIRTARCTLLDLRGILEVLGGEAIENKIHKCKFN